LVVHKKEKKGTVTVTATEAAAETRPAHGAAYHEAGHATSLRGSFSALVALVALGSDLY